MSKTSFYLISMLLCVTYGVVVVPSYAKDSQVFTPHNIILPFTVTQPIIAADILPDTGLELLIVGIDKQQQRILAIYAFDSVNQQYIQADMLKIARHYFAFDVGEIGASGLQRLYLLSKNAVSRYVPAHLSHDSNILLVEQVSSLYLADTAFSFTHKDFIRDINDDGLDDVILPDFEQLNLWLSDCCGLRHAQSLPIAPWLETRDDSVIFHDPEVFFQDMNLDGKTDIVTAQQGNLHVFVQNADMQFSTQPMSISMASNIFALNWWDMLGPDDQGLDQSNLKHRKLKDIKDLNGDGLPDLAVQFTQSSGVLDKAIEFEFYYATAEQKTLSYTPQANAKVTSSETLSNLRFLDTDMDGKQEVIVSAFDIGISQIIGALLSGSIDQNLLLFSMDDAGQFSTKPDMTQEVEMTFSLSSGTSGEPLAKLLDVNGDGVKDVVYSDGNDSIRVKLATPKGKKPYAKKALKQEIIVPNNASDSVDQDLNGDNKTDLVLSYGRTDKKELLNTVLVLIAN